MMAVEDASIGQPCAVSLSSSEPGTTCFIDPGSYFPRKQQRRSGKADCGALSRSLLFHLHSTPIGELPEG